LKHRSRFMQKLLSFFLVSSLVMSPLLVPAAVHAEGPLDPAPFIQPAGTPNGKKVLFDNTHAQTAGAADWVIDGAFSDFANALAANGYYVKELRKTTPIVAADLTGYDVFVIPEANIPYKTTEQQALLDYVEDGGSIFFISDHYNADRNKNRWDSSEAFNGYRRGAWSNPAQGMSAEEAASEAMQGVVSSDWLGENFGVRFRYNALGDINATQIVAPAQAFGITAGVSSVAMHAGSTLAIMDPQKAKGIVYLPLTAAKWSSAVDQGVYEGGGVDEGPYAAVAKVGAGKAAFIGDSSPVEDATPKYKREETGGNKTTYDGFLEQDDGVFLVNVINWLATSESYTSLSQVPGLVLDQATSLLPMETPQTSTEPKPEPWAAPAAGYKWYDSATFKSGSYGYGSDPGNGGGGTGVFFSEYLEGSSYNKALEIYNGTGASINLSGYTIEQSNTSSDIILSGTLSAGDVYVVAHPSAGSAILAAADLTSSVISFNGDDAVTLKQGGSAIDVIGSSGVSFGTDKTLVRKSTVTQGSTAYAASEWDSYAVNTTSYLGSHTAAAPVNQPPVTANPIADQSVSTGSGALVISASGVFTDPDGDTLTLTAASANPSVASVAVSGLNLTVTPLAAGSSAISVTANDGKGGTVTDSFTVVVTGPSVSTLNETYESGTKAAYTAGNVTLASGSWYFDNALIGNLTTDKKNGSQSARIRAAGSIAMNFNVSGAQSVKIRLANFGSDSGATWKVQKSVNSGTSWADVTSASAASSTLTQQTVTVGEAGQVRFRIVVEGTSSSRLNVDDFEVVN
jgi:hypothetical protein